VSVWLSACVLAVMMSLVAERSARADGTPPFVIVVNAKNPSSALTRDFIADAFLKKATRWDDGETIRPVDLGPGSGVRREFTSDVLKRSVAAVRSYWQQRIFSGRDVPPPELASDEAVLIYVQRNRGAIGYLSGGAPLRDVKVVAVH
jgi:ABC-type phosphate transport system substrate-binding protein